jgi:sterol carrier protein 2
VQSYIGNIAPSPKYSALTMHQDGAACCIVASEDFVHAHGLENQSIEIVAQGLETDDPAAYDTESAMEVAGYGMSKRCADKVFKDAGFADGEGRDLVGVVELHDCFSANEVSTPFLT